MLYPYALHDPKIWLSVALIGGLMAGCGEVTGVDADAEPPSQTDAQTGTNDAGDPDSSASDAGESDVCEPETSVCADGEERICDEDGAWGEPRDCALACDEEGLRCLDIEPSNGLGAFWDEAAESLALELPDGATIDTSTGAIIAAGESIPLSGTVVDAPEGGADVRVYPVASLEVTGEVVVSGEPAIAFVADGDVDLDGIIRVRGEGDAGPGSLSDGTGEPGESEQCNLPDVDLRSGGIGGAGFGAEGGAGGDAGSFEGGAGGPEAGSEELVPLRGGSGTRAGGAVQIVSRKQVVVQPGAAVDAGAGEPEGSGPGSSGGGILLEAPRVVLAGDAALAANGAGGGCISPESAPEAGRLDDQPAAGCVTDEPTRHGDGGHGGAGDQPAGGPGESTEGFCPALGGSGGGAAGRIRINTYESGFEASDASILSPTPSFGAIGVIEVAP